MILKFFLGYGIYVVEWYLFILVYLGKIVLKDII